MTSAKKYALPTVRAVLKQWNALMLRTLDLRTASECWAEGKNAGDRARLPIKNKGPYRRFVVDFDDGTRVMTFCHLRSDMHAVTTVCRHARSLLMASTAKEQDLPWASDGRGHSYRVAEIPAIQNVMELEP